MKFSNGALVLVCFSLLSYEISHSSPTTYSTRASWQSAAGPSTNIDFSVDDSGNALTSPSADISFLNLTISGVSFLNIRSYWNQGIYTSPGAVIRVNLPPGTTAFGTDLTPFYSVPGSYTITLSSGEAYTPLPNWGSGSFDFFGVVSTGPIQWVEFSYDNSYLYLDNFSFVAPSAIQVGIDVRPDSDSNPVNPKSRGLVPVALFSTGSFDATAVDIASLRFGPSGTEAPVARYSVSDIDGDGLADLLLKFRTPLAQFTCGASLSELKGKTATGQDFEGSDSIRTVGCQP